MRVTFVIPPSGFLLDERVFPTLGVLKVAAVLEASGMGVDVLDFSGVADWSGQLAQHLSTSDSNAYGITATMPQMPSAAAIAAQIRSHRPEVRLILGGPHVTLMHTSARQEWSRGTPGRAVRAIADLQALFDVLVCGDGERAIWLALQDQAPALVDADDTTSTLFMTSPMLDAAPLAARHLIDLDSYHYQIDGARAHSVVAQLGCPFGCQFCGGRRSAFLRKIRTRTTQAVLQEIQHLSAQYGTRGVMFFDDELNVNKQFMELLTALRDWQEAEGIELRLRGFLKAELITDEMVAAMYASGFRQVLVGFESGHERILQNIKKIATREDNTRAMELLHAHGMSVKAAMSIGHPGENWDTLEATKQWLIEVAPDEFDVSIITVYPGTPYYDDARESAPGFWTFTEPRTGDRLHAVAVDHLTDVSFYKGIPGSYQSFVFTDYLSQDDLCRSRDRLESEVRDALKIPYPVAPAALQYEHSMGQR